MPIITQCYGPVLSQDTPCCQREPNTGADEAQEEAHQEPSKESSVQIPSPICKRCGDWTCCERANYQISLHEIVAVGDCRLISKTRQEIVRIACPDITQTKKMTPSLGTTGTGVGCLHLHALAPSIGAACFDLLLSPAIEFCIPSLGKRAKDSLERIDLGTNQP